MKKKSSICSAPLFSLPACLLLLLFLILSLHPLYHLTFSMQNTTPNEVAYQNKYLLMQPLEFPLEVSRGFFHIMTQDTNRVK